MGVPYQSLSAFSGDTLAGHQESCCSVGSTNELISVLLVEESVAPGTADGGEDSTIGIAFCTSKTNSAVLFLVSQALISSTLQSLCCLCLMTYLGMSWLLDL